MQKFEMEQLLPEQEDEGEASVHSKDPHWKRLLHRSNSTSSNNSKNGASSARKPLHWTVSERIRQTIQSTLSSPSILSTFSQTNQQPSSHSYARSASSLSSFRNTSSSFRGLPNPQHSPHPHRRYHRGISCVVLVVILGVLLHLVTVNRRIPQLVPLYDGGGTTSIASHHGGDGNSTTNTSTSNNTSIFPKRPLTVMNADRFKPSNQQEQQQQQQQQQSSKEHHIDNNKNNNSPSSSSFWSKLLFGSSSLPSNSITISKSTTNNDQQQQHSSNNPVDQSASIQPQPNIQSKPGNSNAVGPSTRLPNSNTTTTTNRTPTKNNQPKTIIISPPFPRNPQQSSSSSFNNLTPSPYHYRLDPPPRTTNTSTHFVERWCDLTSHGSKTVDWYPDSWQRRAPAFLIPGAKYSGVTALAHLLAQHPQIVPPLHNKVQFFLPHHFRRFVHPTTQVTKVAAARQRLYAQKFFPTRLLKTDPNLITFDATGSYLLYSAVTPRRIFCVAPWMKLILILQDPIDRMVQQYRAAVRRGLSLSFETWVDKDFQILERVGLMNQTRAFHGSPQEDVAWYDYTSSSYEGIVGRSMYEIQLRQWLQAVVAIGKQPKHTVLMVRAKKFVQDPRGFYKTTLDFVGVNATAHTLDDASIDAANAWLTVNQTYAKSIMSQEYYDKLKGFFDIYMKRLPNVLKHYGLSWAQPTAVDV